MNVVVGGGIAGVSCAQELARLNPESQVLLISAKDTVIEVT
jgi:L-2-hydroxyglutarate oxidase LhgO